MENFEIIFNQIFDILKQYEIYEYNMEAITDYQIGGMDSFDDNIEQIDLAHEENIRFYKSQCIQEIASIMKFIR